MDSICILKASLLSLKFMFGGFEVYSGSDWSSKDIEQWRSTLTLLANRYLSTSKSRNSERSLLDSSLSKVESELANLAWSEISPRAHLAVASAISDPFYFMLWKAAGGRGSTTLLSHTQKALLEAMSEEQQEVIRADGQKAIETYQNSRGGHHAAATH